MGAVVLIPLLVDDPLWDNQLTSLSYNDETVLIPLLVDDPLWVKNETRLKNEEVS